MKTDYYQVALRIKRAIILSKYHYLSFNYCQWLNRQPSESRLKNAYIHYIPDYTEDRRSENIRLLGNEETSLVEFIKIIRKKKYIYHANKLMKI